MQGTTKSPGRVCPFLRRGDVTPNLDTLRHPKASQLEEPSQLEASGQMMRQFIKPGLGISASSCHLRAGLGTGGPGQPQGTQPPGRVLPPRRLPPGPSLPPSSSSSSSSSSAPQRLGGPTATHGDAPSSSNSLAEAQPPPAAPPQKPQPHPQLNKSQSLTNAFSFSESSFFRSSTSEDEAQAETIRSLRKSFASLFSD
ncbi:hypothetical protein GHT09_007346 [Marmota monax]|uniref:Synapsin ATP-binding domain-containing protein n=1 Tax=Marmota monax TaxID=9995 RepID=A0A834QPI7_MARMO|nr:hypothetical protein GHT09_007346 [Marmota monax]